MAKKQNKDSKIDNLETLQKLSSEIKNQGRREPISFFDFLDLASEKPEFVFRDIFKFFYDMMKHYVPPGYEEYPEHKEAIGYLNYDGSKLFVEGCDSPFFADRLFMNRLMNLINNFKAGSVNNHIFIFVGPPGSGKSTFLNNFLQKLEEYSRTEEGTMYKTYWQLDIEKLGGYDDPDSPFHKSQKEVIETVGHTQQGLKKKYLQFSCPRHDHPILMIPKQFRAEFLRKLIKDEDFKDKLFNKKEYEWVLKENSCSICQGLFSTLLEELGEPIEVFKMICARKMHFNRQFGEGISVYNPGDDIIHKPLQNKNLESMIHKLLKNDNVEFVYSDLAKTNNGVLALMDIKENNINRLLELHGIISDGVHKVGLTEERIKSLFVGLVNPEDKVHYENIKSFQDRIISVNISYILDYDTEVEIFKNKFSNNIEELFLPRVLDNFAKIIISTRMTTDSPVIKKWIGNTDKYSKYLDKNALLLKMEVYKGIIPSYLSEEDVKKFNRNIRKEMLQHSEQEGKKGISGRLSLNIFSRFLAKYKNNGNLITMDNVKKFFMNNEELYKLIPSGFLGSLVDMYDYNVLHEVKESIYYYNDEQIERDIRNYLFAINYDIGETKKSKFTGDTIKINEEYFKNIEAIFLGADVSDKQRTDFRKSVLKEYVTKTVAQDLKIKDKRLENTEQFKSLFEKYIRNLKQHALAPFENNDNLRRAIAAYETEKFKSFDERLKRNVRQLIVNLHRKFEYSKEGAKVVSLYVIENELNKKYS